MAIDRTARFEITADDRTRAGLQTALSSFKRFGNEVEARGKKIGTSLQGAFDRIGGVTGLSLGLAGLGAAFGKAVTDSIQFADAIDQASTKLGVGTERLSALAFAAEQSDVPLQDLSAALVKLQLATSKAEGGNKQFLETFRAIGIDFEKFKGLQVDQQFKEVAEGISRLQREADRTRGSVELFGESGAKLLPLFKEGAAGIAELEQRAKDVGLALGPEAIERILAADEAMKGFNASLKGLQLTLAEKAGPLLGELADGVRTLFGGATEAEKLTTKLEFLQRIASRKLDPFVFNFGYVDGGGLVLGPSELKAEIGRIQAKLADLQGQAGGTFSVGTPQGFAPPEEVTVKAKRLRDGEFADSELNAELLRIRANPRVDRSLDSVFEGRRQSYEAQRQVLEQNSQALAELQLTIFEDNEAAIDESLARINDDVLESLEVQKGLFAGFSEEIESTLSDAFFNIGKGADDIGDQLLDTFKRILADQAAKKLIELFTGGEGGGGGQGGGGGGGFGGILSGLIGGIFGGFKAEGGPVLAGKAYVTGERGPELFLPRQSGTIIPNGAGISGRAMTINMPVNIDARGATQDSMAMLMKQLPGILERNNKALKQELRDDKKRGKF